MQNAIQPLFKIRQKETYTVIEPKTLIDIFIKYQIPIAKETLYALEKQQVFLIKGKLNIIEK